MNKLNNKTMLGGTLLLAAFTLQPLFAETKEAEKKEAEFTGPDLEREKRMALEVEDAVLDGDVIYLKDKSDHEFMAIDMLTEDESKGAVIILHGRGFHANWQDAVHPLRTQLPEKGWRTLSLQMPVLEKTAKYFDYYPVFPFATPRIQAGIKYLKSQGVDNIIILAHSCGAHMAFNWVRQHGSQGINGFIGVGMGATDYKQPMIKPFPLLSVEVPMLDVYGGEDYPAVKRLAPERLRMLKASGHKKSKQIIVPEANHYFTDKGDELVEPVVEWLDNL